MSLGVGKDSEAAQCAAFRNPVGLWRVNTSLTLCWFSSVQGAATLSPQAV